MLGDPALWLLVGGIVLGSAGIAAAAAASGPIRDRLRARQIPLTEPSGRRHGEWVLGDPKLAAQLFTALSQLRRELRARDATLPGVAAVMAGHDRLILRLVRPAKIPPFPPWRAEAGDPKGTSWVVDLPELSPQESGLDPYPLLTAVGQVDGWTVLVDLGQAPGLIPLAGDDARTQRLLATVAYQLATTPWSSEVQIVLVGASRPVPVPQPGRLGYVASIEEAIGYAEPAGERPTVLLVCHWPHRIGDQAALARLGADFRRAVLVASRPGETEVRPRPAGPGGQTSSGELLFATPDRAATTAVPPAVTPESVRKLAEPLLTAQARDQRWPAVVDVRLLGPFHVTAPGSVAGEYWPALASLLALAALQPAGVPATIAGTLLPQPDAAPLVARRLHDWLGADPAGLPRLRERHGTWRLSADVRVDLQLFGELVAAADPANERSRLATALVLIQGELFAGLPVGPATAAAAALDRYAAEIRTLVVQVVRRDVELALAAGDPPRAEWAVRQGLLLLPRWEILWRMLLQLQRDHHRDVIPRTVEEMVVALAAGPGRPRPEPATRKLLVQMGHAKAARALR